MVALLMWTTFIMSHNFNKIYSHNHIMKNQDNKNVKQNIMFFFFGQSKHYVISKPKKYLAHSDLT